MFITIDRFIQEEEGQSTVEYMLLISVIVIAIVAAAYIFFPTFQQGVQELAKDVSSILDSGKIGQVGFDRGAGGS
jgi:Flp pilus assembly pilin Flp